MERLRFITSLIGCLQASARRRQAREALFNSQVIPSGGSSAIASLISLMPQPIPVRMYARGVLAGLSGSYGNLLRKRGGRRYNAEQAAPGSGGKKAAPFLSEMLASGRFRLCGGGYLLLRPDPAIRVPSVGAAIRTSAKLKSVPYVPAAAASRGNIGTSRDGRHIRHRFGDQSCIIGRCSH